jgi:hypothetical protein
MLDARSLRVTIEHVLLAADPDVSEKIVKIDRGLSPFCDVAATSEVVKRDVCTDLSTFVKEFIDVTIGE